MKIEDDYAEHGSETCGCCTDEVEDCFDLFSLPRVLIDICSVELSVLAGRL